jgi:hypothetical protein
MTTWSTSSPYFCDEGEKHINAYLLASGGSPRSSRR